MKLKNLLFLLILIAEISNAQNINLNISLDSKISKEMKLYIKAMSNQDNGSITEIKQTNNQVKCNISKAYDGFYTIYGIYHDTQLLLPVFLNGNDSNIKLTFDGNALINNTDANNLALSEFNKEANGRVRYFWENQQKFKPEEYLSLLKQFFAEADSITTRYKCDEIVKRYIEMNAYTSAYYCYSSLFREKGRGLPFKSEDVFASTKMFDTPMSSYFQESKFIIISSLPSGSLDDKLSYLRNNYQCKQVVYNIEDALLKSYISGFNYQNNYQQGEKYIELLIAKYNLSATYLSLFKEKKSTIKSSSFPQNIKLEDINGKIFDIASLRGNYIYIDLWASWCVPCCKEVPHLQKLEKELKNKNVKFVSISVDKDTKSWTNRMKSLNMQGIQLINRNNAISSALNLTGIPCFLIYDKEGKLYRYKAPRPSSADEIKQILENLN